VIAAVTALAAAAVGGWWSTTRDTSALPHRHPTLTFTLAPLNPPQATFTLGSPLIEQYGKTVQILSVRPVMSANLQFLGADAVWPTDNEMLSESAATWPDPLLPRRHPISEVIPASVTGFTTPGTNGGVDHLAVSITMGFRVLSGDVAAVNGILVAYKVNGDIHHQFFADAMIACVKPNPCKAPQGVDHEDWTDGIVYQLGIGPKP
jgi:hypothetical protein